MRCYVERDIDTASRPSVRLSVRDVELNSISHSSANRKNSDKENKVVQVYLHHLVYYFAVFDVCNNAGLI